MRSELLIDIKKVLSFALAALFACCACACVHSPNGGPADPDVIDVLAPTDAALSALPVQPTDPGVTETAPANTGEVDLTPEPSDEPTEEATETPAPSETASAEPTPAPTAQGGATPTPYTVVPDPYAAPIWFDDSAPVTYDLDFDGKPDKIRIEMKQQSGYNYTCTVTVTLGSNGKEIKDSFATEYFTKALVNNFNSGDHRAELLVSCGTGNRGQVTKIYRLNPGCTALMSISTNGWVETLANDGNSFELGRYIDVLGTWACSCRFGFAASDLSLVQQDTAWMIHRDSDRWCTVSDTLLVEILIPNSSENYAGFLYYGDKIFPTESDLKTYIKFEADYGDIGTITVSVGGNGDLLINGQSPDSWFSDLTYIR